MEKQDFKSPLARTILAFGAAVSAFIVGLYAVKFSGSGWDWGSVAGCLGMVALCLLLLFVLMRGFLMPNT
jgi:Mg2+ and Co2+ transporter CorA